MRHLFITGFLLASLFVAGCHENVKLRLPDIQMVPAEKEFPLTISVVTFQDKRPTSEHVGVHIYDGGEKEYFSMRDGSLGHVATQSFIHFLNQSGFSAFAATDTESADILIEADIEQFNADATDRLLYSFLEVDMTMVFTIHNVADGSATRVRIAAGETSNEWPVNIHTDMEMLINAVLKEGFMNLLDTGEIQTSTSRVISHSTLKSFSSATQFPTLSGHT